MATFDDVFHYIGTYGKYQWRVFFLCLGILSVPYAFQVYLNTFTFATPFHRCRLLSIPSDTYHWNASSPQSADVLRLIPRTSDNSTLDSCHYRNHTGTFPNIYVDDNASVIECDSWVYDDTFYPDNVVTRLNLVCRSEQLVTVANSAVFVGMLLGSIVFGDVSDRYGRHRALSLGEEEGEGEWG